jgi:CubicO group peptidase (beta-lactamase class C family)
MKKSTFITVGKALCFFAAADAFSAQQSKELPKVNSDCSITFQSNKKLFESRMDDYIAAQMKEKNGAGLSIVVVDNDSVIYEKGFGLADKEKAVPVGKSTLFHIGSITKLFTGIGIMQLAQKGLIDIDAPIERYLPEFSIKYHKYPRQTITVRSIMAHQSGIFGDKEYQGSDSVYPAEDFRAFPEFTKHEYAAYAPNYTTAYSNFAVSLLGAIIERVSHQKYEDYIAANILKPCGMDESGFDPKKDNEALLAKGYDADGKAYPYYYIACNPAGFLATNADNMANFMKMILHDGYYNQHRLLDPDVLHSMYNPQSIYLPMNLGDDYGSFYNFGLSWMLQNKSMDYLGKVVGHGGNLPPYNSNMLIAKDHNIGVFITANKADFYPDEISYFALTLAAKIFKKLDKPSLPAVAHTAVMSEFQKKFYSGSYTLLGSEPIEIYSDHDTLFLQQLHSTRIPLVFHVDGWVSPSINDSLVQGIRLAVKWIDNQKVLCEEDRDSTLIYRMIIGNHFVPNIPPDSSLAKLTGDYSEVSSPASPAIRLSLDSLSQSKAVFLKAVELSNNACYCVNSSDGKTFITQGLGRGAQETAYFTSDTLNYSGYRLIKSPVALARTSAAASLAKTNAKLPTATQKSAEEVIKDLKDSAKKMRLF